MSIDAENDQQPAAGVTVTKSTTGVTLSSDDESDSNAVSEDNESDGGEVVEDEEGEDDGEDDDDVCLVRVVNAIAVSKFCSDAVTQ